MDAMDLNSQRDDDDDDEDEDVDDWDTNANGCSPKDDRDCDAQGDPSLAKNVGVLITLLLRSSTRNLYIQQPSALLIGNISKNVSSVSELTSPCTLFPLTWLER